MRFRAAGVALALAGLVIPGIVAAESHAPPATPVACTVEPTSIDLLMSWFFDESGAPIATPEPSAPVSTDADLPQGKPADAETAADVSAVVSQWNTCFTTGQYARGFSLMTERLGRLHGPDTADPAEDTPEEVRALLESQLAGTPVAGTVEEDSVFTGPLDMRVLDDGRVGAIWDWDGYRVFIVVVKQDDSWLIDDIIEIQSAATPTS